MNPGVGNDHYRAPELFLNFDKYDCRIDVWSLGVVFSEIL